jgi:hypothetical protein
VQEDISSVPRTIQAASRAAAHESSQREGRRWIAPETLDICRHLCVCVCLCVCVHRFSRECIQICNFPGSPCHCLPWGVMRTCSSEALLGLLGQNRMEPAQPANQPTLLLQHRRQSARHRSAIGCRSQGAEMQGEWRRNLTPPLLGADVVGRVAWTQRRTRARAVEKSGPVRPETWDVCFPHVPWSPMTLLPWHHLRAAEQPRARADRPPNPRPLDSSARLRFTPRRFTSARPFSGPEWCPTSAQRCEPECWRFKDFFLLPSPRPRP